MQMQLLEVLTKTYRAKENFRDICGHNNLGLFEVFQNFSLTTRETEHDY